MISILRPIIFQFLQSDKVKVLVIDLLTKLAEQSSNNIDDQAVAFIRAGLFPSDE